MATSRIFILLLSVALLPLAFTAVEEKFDYNGYQVFTVILQNEAQVALFQNLVADVWKEPAALTKTRDRANAPVYTDVMIAPENIQEFKQVLEQHQIPVAVKVADVGALIKEQEVPEDHIGTRAVEWTAYYRYAEINAWVDEIVAANSDIASVRTIATSTDGRDIKMVKISKVGSAPNKTAILVDGGFHAREWISPAVATYIINELLSNTAANAEALDAVDFYIIPLVNPDGYEFSHTNTRLWRKTRSDHNSALGCRGVDPNRNYEFQFGGPGTSNDKCSEIYRGPSAYSEPEVKGVIDVVMDTSVNWAAYFTIHSYGLMWLFPWSYTYNVAADYDELLDHAQVGADALAAVSGTRYTVGASSEVYGLTAGCSDDGAKAAGIKYAATIEVRDTGNYGFILPPSQIIPTSVETWAGIRALALYKY